MLPILSDLKSYHYQFRESNELRKELSHPEGISITSRILTALPPRTFCDRAVAFYMQHFENVYRILHVPTFMQDYSMVWETNNECIIQLESFVPQLAAVVAIAAILDQDCPPTSPSRPEERSLGIRLFGLVDEWLRHPVPRKQPLLDSMRVRTLLQLARLMRIDPTKAQQNVWVSTGGLVRFAISQNLHRDPSDVPGISIFEGEQRRRLWATVQEMDLQASIICGRTPFPSETTNNCRNPANFMDEDLHEGMSEFPSPRSLDEWTGTLVQVILSYSLPLRFKALSGCSQISPVAPTEPAFEIVEQLERFIATVPETLRIPSSPHESDFGIVLSQLLCDLHLRRPLICLWQKMASVITNDWASMHARLGCLRSAMMVLSRHETVGIATMGVSGCPPRSKLNLFLGAFSRDVLQAALSLCWEIRRRKRFPLYDLGYQAGSNLFLSRIDDGIGPAITSTDDLLDNVEETRDFLLNNVGSIWIGVKNALRLSVISASVKPAMTDAAREDRMHVAITQVLQLCQQCLPSTLVELVDQVSAPVDSVAAGLLLLWSWSTLIKDAQIIDDTLTIPTSTEYANELPLWITEALNFDSQFDL